ncbi:MAG TPA: hypothetical protein PLR76_04040 [Hyphomonas sp.]|nr:hypothetical protein [Hyphomonas sp.]
MVRPPGKAGAAGARFPLGLGERGVHELAEAAYGDMPALTGFALAAAKPRKGAILWVTQAAFAAAHGQVLPHGAVGYPAGRAPLLIVRPRKLVEALWTIEEGLRSSAVGLVIADVEGADFTATRRLALASGRHGTPLVLLMPHDREGATAASARWRIGARPSAPNRFDPHAPGRARWQAVLERSREAPWLAGHVFDLDYDDETLSLTVVSGMAAGQAAPRAPGGADGERAPPRLAAV